MAAENSDLLSLYFAPRDSGWMRQLVGVFGERAASCEQSATETTVDLDGVPVHVSWLEEETLAYARRGRLGRAAECLPHCDHDRLLALLRGEQAAGVL